MQEIGWIRRRRLDEDQRRVRVSLTARSRDLARTILPAIEATYRRLESEVGEDFSRRLYAMIDALIDALRDPDPRV
jgi:DNA-binding MarR family transcriptional regulator